MDPMAAATAMMGGQSLGQVVVTLEPGDIFGEHAHYHSCLEEASGATMTMATRLEAEHVLKTAAETTHT